MSAHNGAAAGKAKRKRTKLRAHANPLSLSTRFACPTSPAQFDLSQHYLPFTEAAGADSKGQDGATDPPVEIADIGCGFGGLTVGLSRLFPGKRTLAMEIRTRVVDSVQNRITRLRNEHQSEPHHLGCPPYGNISVVLTNAMKFLPNYFAKGQLSKMFFCFPDPHFKRSNHRRRIISPALLTEYAYALRIGGRAYTISDVKDLHIWMVAHFEAHPAFERVPDEELKDDPCVELMTNGTEEGQKVTRNRGSKYPAVFRRVQSTCTSALPLDWSQSTQLKTALAAASGEYCS